MKARQGLALGAAVTALAAGIGTVSAFAAVPIPGADGKIRACVKYEDINKYEQMRWITKTTCPKGEKLIAWNAKGVKGDKGETGATGAQGAPGAPGADGAPGSSEAFHTNSNSGFAGIGHPTTVHDITVEPGKYAVAATTEVRNLLDDKKVVACALNTFNGQTKRRVQVGGKDSDVLTLVGVLYIGDEGKIKVICSSVPETDDNQTPEYDDTQILATKIG